MISPTPRRHRYFGGSGSNCRTDARFVGTQRLRPYRFGGAAVLRACAFARGAAHAYGPCGWLALSLRWLLSDDAFCLSQTASGLPFYRGRAGAPVPPRLKDRSAVALENPAHQGDSHSPGGHTVLLHRPASADGSPASLRFRSSPWTPAVAWWCRRCPLHFFCLAVFPPSDAAKAAPSPPVGEGEWG
jgi:hypothetical protein